MLPGASQPSRFLFLCLSSFHPGSVQTQQVQTHSEHLQRATHWAEKKSKQDKNHTSLSRAGDQVWEKEVNEIPDGARCQLRDGSGKAARMPPGCLRRPPAETAHHRLFLFGCWLTPCSFFYNYQPSLFPQHTALHGPFTNLRALF